MKKKQYVAPVCQVTETEATTVLAASPYKSYTDVDVDNEASDDVVVGDVNKNEFEDILW